MDNTDVTDFSRSGLDLGPALSIEGASGQGASGLSLIAARGERIALLGPQGSAVDVLCGWLSGRGAPVGGRVVIGGRAVKPGSAKRLRDHGVWAVGSLYEAPRFMDRLRGAPAEADAPPEDALAILAVAGEATPQASGPAWLILCRRFEDAAAFPRIAIFDDRRKVADDTPAALSERYGGSP